MAYFADRNKNLIGKKINNIEIIGLEKLKCNKDYLVLIAVGTEKIYSCMTTLIKHGVEQYSVFLDNNYTIRLVYLYKCIKNTKGIVKYGKTNGCSPNV